MNAMHTLAGGLLGLAIATGVGAGVLRLLGAIPVRYRFAFALVCGVASIDWAVSLVLFLGGGLGAVKITALAAALIGTVLLIVLRNDLPILSGYEFSTAADFWFTACVLLAAVINLLIAVAPSTKIDELHYHMLIPERVLQDGGLHLYRQPFEAAIFPQTAFQLGLTLEHAARFPEAGNVLNWGIGLALVFLVVGVVQDLTGSSTAGWVTGAVSAVGLYPAVWHVASGPQALGDLAMVIACLLTLLPDSRAGEWNPTTKLVLVCLAAYVTASTKISNLPVAAALTVLGVIHSWAAVGLKKATGIALFVWVACYGPILAWTTAQCGSPFGLATATLFHSRYFGPETLARLDFARMVGPTGWRAHLSWLIPSVSAGVVAAFGIVAVAAFRRGAIFKTTALLVCAQALLIYWLLPHEFRFLAGLQYVVLILGASIFWPSGPGAWLVRKWSIAFIVLCVPWVAVQVYYAKPFIAVDAGLISRNAFLERYVAFEDDFRALDRILPANAVLYVVNTRIPSYYAPRPVILTLEDLRARTPLYRFAVGPDPPLPQHSLSCAETVYEDDNAVVETYRTPGRLPEHGPLKVERCTVLSDSPGVQPLHQSE